MSSGFLDTLATGSIDLGVADIVEPTAGTLCVTAKANANRCGLALLCALVAVFTAWHTRREVQASGTLGLWPGIVIVGVFAGLVLALLFYEQQKTFDARRRTAVVAGHFLGLSAHVTHVLPEHGLVRLSASVELTRSEPQGVRRVYTYRIDVADDAALGFELQGDRATASAFANRLAQLLGYVVVADLEEDEVAGWRAISIGERGA
ncbi:MAG: hypothetical protein AB7I32_08750 [Gammaproteobacteria bacterium]